MNHETEWLDNRQAAKYLGLSEKTLSRLRYEKKSPKYYKQGKIRYLKSDLDAWVKSKPVEE